MSATDRLDQIEARVNAATEGKNGWHQGRGDRRYEAAVEVYSEREVSATSEDICRAYRPEDAAFIAHARTDVPDLVAALRAVHTIAFDPDTISALEHGHIEFGPNLFEGVSKDDALSYARDALKDIRDAIEEALS